MPHFIAECTDNIREAACLPELFEKVHTYLASTGLFPLPGIRSRAHWLDTYRMADDEENYGFVHMRLQIGVGRTLAERQQTGTALFEIIKAHFAELMASSYLALSFELTELSAECNYKQNNIHQRFKDRAC